MNVCVDCKYFHDKRVFLRINFSPELCLHPEAAHLITGEPRSCYLVRTDKEGIMKSYCHLFEAKE